MISPHHSMSRYETLTRQLAAEPHRWLITGVAGFVGSHLLETLLTLDQQVTGLDNFTSGSRGNLDEVRSRVSPAQWARFTLHEGSVADRETCQTACAGMDYVLHQAGFVSVPLSLEDPLACHETNVTGTLQILLAAREAHVRCVVYASSSAVYGDDTCLPKVESSVGHPLSPYGASKLMAEMYARLFEQQFQISSVGLRYFNIFGPRQNPTGGYAAVIPQWISKLLGNENCVIHGSGGITRDFCPVADVVQANLLAATNPSSAGDRVFNVALGGSTTLDQLHTLLSEAATALGLAKPRPVRYGPAREGDILHSAADISAIRKALEFEPSASLRTALLETVRWYASQRPVLGNRI
jgi:UDP-N-acetylglucosamine 4-epimerase